MTTSLSRFLLLVLLLLLSSNHTQSLLHRMTMPAAGHFLLDLGCAPRRPAASAQTAEQALPFATARARPGRYAAVCLRRAGMLRFFVGCAGAGADYGSSA